MSVRIRYDGKEILHTKSNIVGSIHSAVLSIIEKGNIYISESLNEMLDHLYLAGYGVDFDIAHFIKSKRDKILFAELIKKVIEKEKKEQSILRCSNSFFDKPFEG